MLIWKEQQVNRDIFAAEYRIRMLYDNMASSVPGRPINFHSLFPKESTEKMKLFGGTGPRFIPPRSDIIFYHRKYQHLFILDLYKKWMITMMARWCSTTFYSPSTTLCQSSGYGKSKLMIELGQHFHVFYVCLRKPLSTGIPSRTDHAAPMLTETFTTEAEFGRFLLACLVVARDRGLAVHTDLFVAMKDGSQADAFWASVMLLCQSTVMDSYQFTSAADALLADQASCGILFVFDEARELLGNIHLDNSEVTSRLRLLRRALRNLGCNQERKGFGIFVDTAPEISNVASQDIHDSTARDFLGTTQYPVGFALPTMGNVATALKREYWVRWWVGSHIICTDNLSALVSLSRPMFVERWEAYCNNLGSGIIMPAWTELRAFARKKLTANIGTWAYAFGPNRMWEDVAVAIVACRVAYIPPAADKNALVGSHMATLLSISNCQSRLEVEYVAEVVLGEAACWCWRDDSEDLLNQSILTFLKCIKSGHSGCIQNDGELGEVVAMILLCRAFDECGARLNGPSTFIVKSEDLPMCDEPHVSDAQASSSRSASSSSSSSSSFSSSSSSLASKEALFQASPASKLMCAPVSVIAYIERIRDAGSSLKKEFSSLDYLHDTCWEQGVVAVSQFVNSETHITTEMLLEAAKRRVAYKCPKGEQGVDLVIPVIFAQSFQNGHWILNLQDFKAQDLGVILVVVSNFLGKGSPEFSVSDMARNIAGYAEGFEEGIPYIGMLMALGNENIFVDQCTQDRKYLKVLQSARLSSVQRKAMKMGVPPDEGGMDEEDDSDGDGEAIEQFKQATVDTHGLGSARSQAENRPTCARIQLRAMLPHNFVFGFDSFFDEGIVAPLFPLATLGNLKDMAALDGKTSEDQFWAAAGILNPGVTMRLQSMSNCHGSSTSRADQAVHAARSECKILKHKIPARSTRMQDTEAQDTEVQDTEAQDTGDEAQQKHKCRKRQGIGSE
jgi:hypothetical protein